MLKMIKQARAALSLLNPEEVRKQAEKPVSFGLVAADGRGYAELEDFLAPASVGERREELMNHVHRAGDPGAPEHVDVVLFEHGIEAYPGAYTFDRDNPRDTIARIVKDHSDFALSLAARYPAFRKPVVEDIIRSVAGENALFAVATALPDVIPSFVELPWAFGEFASDTAFLTGNQLRMAFQIAAAYHSELGFTQQKGEVLSIVAGAFGWRAIARELVGKIPLGGGLIPKGAIAWAGTYVVGKSLEYYYEMNHRYPRGLRRKAYREALEAGKQVAGSVVEKLRPQKAVN